MKKKAIVCSPIATLIMNVGKTNTHKSTILGMYKFPVPEILKKDKK